MKLHLLPIDEYQMQTGCKDTGDTLVAKHVKWNFKRDHRVKVKKNKAGLIFWVVLVLIWDASIFFMNLSEDWYLTNSNSYFLQENVDMGEYISWILLVLMTILVNILIIAYVTIIQRAYFILGDEAIDYKVGKKQYSIPYRRIKKAEFVVHNGMISPDYKERGIAGYKLTVNPYRGRGWHPYYDLIDDNDQFICAVDVNYVFSEGDFRTKLLYKGIKVKGRKHYCKLMRNTLKGEEIEQLRTHPVQKVSADTIQKYIHFYNDKVSAWNKRKVNLLRKNRPLMELDDSYEAGCIYWTEDLQEVRICFRNGEMQREPLGNYLAVNRPMINTVVYYIRNLNKEITILDMCCSIAKKEAKG